MQKRYPLCFQFDRSNRTSGHLLRSITAKATDNSGNAASNSTSSAAIQLTVTQGVAQVYYIHTDQLNTPRLITDSNNAKVWEWHNDDPFANNPPNDDPNATGNHFTYNPRLPGQYFDRETNTNYNYYRDYDPSTGRYIESDPIGLNGGINTYGYVGGNPLSYVDPSGLVPNPAEGACLGGPNPICIGGVATDILTNAALGLAAMGIVNDANDSSGKLADKAAERKEYSRVCKSPIPPTGDKCKDAQANLDRLKQCLQLRENFAQKWYSNDIDVGHQTEISNTRQAIIKLEDFIQKNCKKSCG